jgi:murein DD-endopeptidase MepM/ murein hydrolase activator NlpD
LTVLLRNALLTVWILALAVGLGFYLGRVTARDTGPVPAKATNPEETVQTRARLAEPERRTEQTPNSELEQPALAERELSFPVPGIEVEDVRDTFYDKRGSDRIHEAADIMADRGTPVYAVDDGRIEKLFLSVAGGKTIYQFDRSATWCYYYAHLDRYAEGIADGVSVRRGQLIGYVGSTGNADPKAPHLHFAIFELGPEKQYWKGTPVNPYPLLVRALQR